MLTILHCKLRSFVFSESLVPDFSLEAAQRAFEKKQWCYSCKAQRQGIIDTHVSSLVLLNDFRSFQPADDSTQDYSQSTYLGWIALGLNCRRRSVVCGSCLWVVLELNWPTILMSRSKIGKYNLKYRKKKEKCASVNIHNATTWRGLLP